MEATQKLKWNYTWKGVGSVVGNCCLAGNPPLCSPFLEQMLKQQANMIIIGKTAAYLARQPEIYTTSTKIAYLEFFG